MAPPKAVKLQMVHNKLVAARMARENDNHVSSEELLKQAEDLSAPSDAIDPTDNRQIGSGWPWIDAKLRVNSAMVRRNYPPNLDINLKEIVKVHINHQFCTVTALPQQPAISLRRYEGFTLLEKPHNYWLLRDFLVKHYNRASSATGEFLIIDGGPGAKFFAECVMADDPTMVYCPYPVKEGETKATSADLPVPFPPLRPTNAQGRIPRNTI